MHRKRLLCWKAYLPRSSWPTQPTTPIICARPSLPKARSPSSPTTRHGHSNIRSTSISMPSAISWSVASQNSNNSAASQPASKRQPEITLPSSLSQPSSYGCDKCPHHLGRLLAGLNSHGRLQTRRLNPASFSFPFAGRGRLPLHFKSTLLVRGGFHRPGKSGGPPLFEPSFKVQRNDAHSQKLRVRGRPRVKGLNARGPLKVHPKMASSSLRRVVARWTIERSQTTASP